MKFIGAAQQEFSSFMDLARTMLDTYCPNWNNPLDQKSYILPPVCSFKNADKSDEDIEKIRIDLEQQKQAGVPQKSLDSAQRPVIDRFSDSGEFVVFYALWALIQDRVAAPFLAIHGLKLKNIERCLQHIFPQALVDIRKKFEAMMREYDFVLIGPKIGLVIIEVKSSYFTKKKDFAENNKHLPDDIIKGLKQLGSFDPSFFQVCSGSEIVQRIPFRKILFTPNLEKCRFQTWLGMLDKSANEKVKEKFNGVFHWFNEDMANQWEHDQKPPLYSSLHLEVEKSGYDILHKIFESCGLILSGLTSAIVLQNQASVSTEALSTSSAILNDASSLDSQNPKRQQLDKTAAEVVEVESQLVLLTPEQQKAIKGPNRQFIIGAPGSGKTIILQAKAAQLLMEGKNVLISTERSYIEKYRKLFGSYDSCTIRETFRWLFYFPKYCRTRRILKMRKGVPTKLTNSKIFPLLVQNDLERFDSILIDDTFDRIFPDDYTFKTFSIFDLTELMSGASTNEFRSKLVWVACDSYFDNSDGDDYRRRLNKIIQGEYRDYFSTTILDRVMRSSESVFQATYSPQVTQHMAINPVVGHKIHGFYDSVHLCNLSSDDALLEIWKHANGAVKRFKEEGFDYDHMAILTAGDQYEYVRRYLWYKFRENGIRVGYARSQSRKLLTLDTWHEVSSSEWPVIIYIAMFVSHEERKDEAYTRYRACSRATMKLFEIIANVEINLEAVEFYRGSNGDIYGLNFYELEMEWVKKDRASPFYSRTKITSEEGLALEYGGKLFRSIALRDAKVYKFDMNEIIVLRKEFVGLMCPAPTDYEEQKYLEKHKMPGTVTLDDIEFYCRLGKRHDLIEFIVKAQMLKNCNICRRLLSSCTKLSNLFELHIENCTTVI